MSKYLYGASVQGIQGFIFATNKLQEIVGASEIVKSVAKEFEDISGYEEGNPNILINTAGNIKAIFENREDCQKIVLDFAKIISQKAYGITISQAVVEFDGESKDYIDRLEKQLKTQRNKASIPLDMSLNITKLNPRTSKPITEYIYNKDTNKKDIAVDKASKQKIDAFPMTDKYKDISDLSNSKHKIAVIHIDGNGLGKLIPKLKEICGLELDEFSVKLNEATEEAFNFAKENKKVRNVILGGDDVTVICNANDALSFTKEFLEGFEKNTQNIGALTACAGIAYCNEKYPFHYAVDLAEALCGVAKTHTLREHSALMFHNIQSSNYQSWDKFVEDELTIQNNTQTIRCDFGAYYLDENIKPSIKNLIIVIESLRLKDSPSSRLREWLSELYRSKQNAQNLLHRIDKIATENTKYKKSILDDNFAKLHSDLKLDNLIVENKTPIYDILQILSVTEAKK